MAFSIRSRVVGFFLREQTSEFGNAKSQAAKKALLAGHVTISKELCQFNSTLTITERRVRFKNRTMFEGIIAVSYFTERWLPEGRTMRHDQTILRQCIVSVWSVSVIYALNCRSRKRSFGGKFSDWIIGSLSNYDDDHNDDFKKAIVLMIKTTALLHIIWRTWTYDEFSFLFLNLNTFFWLNNRELKQLRRRPQRRLQKNNSFND